MFKVSAEQKADSNLGDLLEMVKEKQEGLVVEVRGHPEVVILSYQDYEELARLKEHARRQALWEEAEKIRKRVQARPINQNLTADEAEQIADRFTRDVIEEMVQEGKIQFIED